MSAPTVPTVKQGLPVRTVRVEVIEGPDAGKRCVSEAGQRISVGTASSNSLVLTDVTVSRFHLDVFASGDAIELIDLGSTNGTLVDRVRVLRAKVAPQTRVKLGTSVVRVEAGETSVVPLHAEPYLGGLLGESNLMRSVMAQLARAAHSDVAVLVTGESGTGKEVAVRALHERSARRAGPLVVVDCGALSSELVASELFGHERGAFTGADRQHVGAFERAQGGTLFLDEVGELSPELQPALLGVLERREFRRVGGAVSLPTDVRVVCATHRDLRTEVNEGRFRADLYYRLAVVTVELPPLRERLEDLPGLVDHFLGVLGASPSTFSSESVAALLRHRWPGNVRELRNLVEASVVLGEARVPEAVPLGSGAAEDLITALLETPYRAARSTLLAHFERRYLTELVERAKGNVAAAARLAQMDRSHLIDLLERNDLKP